MHPESEITSSLLFQQLIYFNWYYSFVEFYLYAASQILRYFPPHPASSTSRLSMECQCAPSLVSASSSWRSSASKTPFSATSKSQYVAPKQFPEICAFLLLTFLTIGAQLMLLGALAPTSPMEWAVIFVGLLLHGFEFIVVYPWH